MRNRPPSSLQFVQWEKVCMRPLHGLIAKRATAVAPVGQLCTKSVFWGKSHCTFCNGSRNEGARALHHCTEYNHNVSYKRASELRRYWAPKHLRACIAGAQRLPFHHCSSCNGKKCVCVFYMVSLQNVQPQSLQSGSFVLNPPFGANLIARFATRAGMKGSGRFIIVQNTITTSHSDSE
ncbi:hypothetical protein PaecuDRAFT_1806 [Paenibacillus curdlanolyticus YK9]|uniref:Uncharacterized protein n=1 Tax=Paenibacillus curdlanolyticus YK9 TaxID=717606 RepID=E0I855_9BACL|nr:hypothetical protein PaecuDRAFT_1806 [Paenibacillus curdlanolyticus YK9]